MSRVVKVKCIITICLILLRGNFTYSQTYQTRVILNRSDSLLKVNLGEKLFSYCKFDSNTYYEYKNAFGKTHWKKLLISSKTKGNFVSTDIEYKFKFPCPQEDSLKGNISVFLDSNLKLRQKIVFDFIPKFLLHDSVCQFISKSEVLEIASKQNLKKGIKDIKCFFSCDKNSSIHKWIWQIDNYISEYKDSDGHSHGKVEILTIDAITKEILSLDKNAIYGHHE